VVVALVVGKREGWMLESVQRMGRHPRFTRTGPANLGVIVCALEEGGRREELKATLFGYGRGKKRDSLLSKN